MLSTIPKDGYGCLHPPESFFLGWGSGVEGLKNHTNGSEHALGHGNVVRLESHWPWEGRYKHGFSSMCHQLEVSRF